MPAGGRASEDPVAIDRADSLSPFPPPRWAAVRPQARRKGRSCCGWPPPTCSWLPPRRRWSAWLCGGHGEVRLDWLVPEGGGWERHHDHRCHPGPGGRPLVGGGGTRDRQVGAGYIPRHGGHRLIGDRCLNADGHGCAQRHTCDCHRRQTDRLRDGARSGRERQVADGFFVRLDDSRLPSAGRNASFCDSRTPGPHTPVTRSLPVKRGHVDLRPWRSDPVRPKRPRAFARVKCPAMAYFEAYFESFRW